MHKYWSSWKLNQRKILLAKKCIPGALIQDEAKMLNLGGDNIEVVDTGQVLLPQ